MFCTWRLMQDIQCHLWQTLALHEVSGKSKRQNKTDASLLEVTLQSGVKSRMGLLMRFSS